MFLADPTPKQITVLLIKPDAVQAGKVDDIVEKVGFLSISTMSYMYVISSVPPTWLLGFQYNTLLFSVFCV